MTTSSITNHSSRIVSYSPDQSDNNSISPELSTDKKNIPSRSDSTRCILLRSFDFINIDKGNLVLSLSKLNIDMFFYELKTTQARRALLAHDAKTRMSILDNVILQNPELNTTVLSSEVQEKAIHTLVDLKKNYAIFLPSISKVDNFSTLSSKEINDLLSSSIGEMSESYLDVFQQAVEKNSQLYKDFSDFLSTLTQFISADGDRTILDSTGFQQSLQQLMNKYPVPDMSTTLFPVQTGSTLQGADREKCEAWAKEFGLNVDDCVKKLPDGNYIVHIDTSPLGNIMDSVKNLKDNSFNAAQWSAWQTGVDMQKDHIQNNMQTLTQKFANAHSTFDNLVKILSSTIASLLECDKQFFV